jgi:integrase
MASIDKLPSGRWRGRVKRGGVTVDTFTHPLKGTVERWARDVERKIDAGEWHDPKLAKVTVADWRETWLRTTRLAAPATLDKDAAHWRTRIEPRWGDVLLSEVERDEVKGWVRELVDAEVGAHSIHGAVHHLSALLQAAVEAGKLKVNPAQRIKLPTPDLKAPFFWTHEEVAALLGVLDDPWRLMVALDMKVGLRWAELAGLKRRAVDLEHGVIHVVGTQTRKGWVPLTKGRSLRTVPIPPLLLPDLRRHVTPLDPDALVFTAAGGGALHDTNFRRRQWAPALKRAGVRTGTPHDMRHTAASHLVMAGVDLYRVQALLGHESFRTTAGTRTWRRARTTRWWRCGDRRRSRRKNLRRVY